MKTTMKMSDLKVSYGFPDDIDRNKMVVVQVMPVTSPLDSTVLYTEKKTGKQSCWFLTMPDNRFESKIYVINPK